MIKTNHESLKHLLQQRLHTAVQQKGMTKFLCLSYTILYRKGMENKAADALSRIPSEEEELRELKATSIMVPLWQQEVAKSYSVDLVA